MPPDRTQTLRAFALLAFTAMCWGANASFSRLAVDEVSPMLHVCLRWIGSVLILFAIAGRQIMRERKVLQQHWLFLILMGAFGFCAFNTMMFIAAHNTTAVNIGIIQGSMPALILIGVFLVYRTPITHLQILGVVIAIIGVVYVVVRGDITQLQTLTFNQGDLLMLSACALYAGYAVALRNRPPASPLPLFAAMACAAMFASIPLAIYESTTPDFLWPTPKGWAVTAAVTLFPSVLAQLAFIHAVTVIGPARAGIFTNLVPIFAATFAVLFLQETFGAYHAIALALVIGGIWLSERSKHIPGSEGGV